MHREPYLLRLGARLTTGLAGLDHQRRRRHAEFLRAQRQADGGFTGREGDSDLYYTSFAVRGLVTLGEFGNDDAHAVADYLRTLDQSRLGIIDLMNWLSLVLAVQAQGGQDLTADQPPDWVDQVCSRLESVRTADGGYAKSPEGAIGSTYHSFLVMLAYELVGRSVPEPDRLIQFLFDQQRDDGGFVEIAPMRRSGTNPTAAAAAVLDALGAMDDELRSDVAAFFRDVRSDEGGLQANTRVPFADGLSTFTGLLTLQDLEIDGVLDPARVRRFIEEWLEFPTGGFRAASWDEAADVEYTFYGLGVLALLS